MLERLIRDLYYDLRTEWTIDTIDLLEMQLIDELKGRRAFQGQQYKSHSTICFRARIRT